MRRGSAEGKDGREDSPTARGGVDARGVARLVGGQPHDERQRVAGDQPQGQRPAAPAARRGGGCFGWVDSRPARLDERRSQLLMSPRRAGSAWSGINKDRVRRLTEAGLMVPAGLAAVARAEADGSWTRLDGATALEEPADLLAALAARPGASAAWRGFPPSHCRANLEWLAAAKRADTRAARVAEIALRAARGERANT